MQPLKHKIILANQRLDLYLFVGVVLTWLQSFQKLEGGRRVSCGENASLYQQVSLFPTSTEHFLSTAKIASVSYFAKISVSHWV